jgi:AhpD family alkylhydroperoxidase
MQARIKNPALSVPGALDALQQLGAAATTAGIPESTLYIAQLRASQINGCSVCVDIHSRELEHAGESSERIHTLATWRETPYFSGAERAALALTEAATRLSDRSDPVPDYVWDEAARHFTEEQLAALVVAIAAINAPPQ